MIRVRSRIAILVLIAFAGLVATIVMPRLSVSERLELPCPESLRWTDAEVGRDDGSSALTPSNVILVMLDGVRWQEFLNGESGGKPIFEYLHSTTAQGAYIFGDDRVSNPQLVSLPAYQSIFAGAVQSCESNGCGRITAETFAERAARELKLTPTKVATIASWSVMTCAVESAPKSTFVNAGDVPLHDGIVDGEHAENNRLQEAAKWTSKNKRGFARPDEHTYRHALMYLRRHRPNFLFISLLDSDMYAHERNYTAYRKTLQRYDHWLKQLAETLDSMGEYGRKTALIVTTDHGRGAGQESWTEHGVNVPEASRIWTYVRLPKNGSYRIVDPSRSHSHIDIRPTVETLLGMEPLRCDGCGASFVEKST